MRQRSTRPVERRKAILEAAVRVISRDGVRALTHRAVDREAGIPQGTTSYHASTRQALLGLVVGHLVERSDANVQVGQALVEAAACAGSGDAAVESFVDAMCGIVDGMSSRVDDMRARYALLIELDDGELRGRLALDSPVLRRLVETMAEPLARFGVADPRRTAMEIFGLGDGFIWQRTVLGLDPDVRGIYLSYVRGASAA